MGASLGTDHEAQRESPSSSSGSSGSGFGGTKQTLLQTVLGIASETYTCAPSPVQHAAAVAYDWSRKRTASGNSIPVGTATGEDSTTSHNSHASNASSQISESILSNREKTEKYVVTVRRVLRTVGLKAASMLSLSGKGGGGGVRCHAPVGGFYVMPDFSPMKEALQKRSITTSNEL